MTNPLQHNFSPGGLPDRVDNRDYQWEEIGGAISVPFDWSIGFNVEDELSTVLNIPNFKLKVKDQGGSYSCGGQAWGYLAEVLEAMSTKSYEPRSAKYMYSQTCVPTGGSRGRDNADIFVNQGVSKESTLVSYDNNFPPQEPFMQRSADITDLARQDAKLSKSSAYAQTGIDIESIATAVRDNHGVVLGVDGANNGTWNGEFPSPPNTIEWRHWVYAFAAKLINGKKHIGIVNSWGSNVGNQGIQWLSIDYFNTSHVFSGWTHVFAPPIVSTFKHNFIKNMNLDEISGDVVALQNALKLDGEFPMLVPSSGFYGDITKIAVLAFQFKYKIITLPIESNYGRIVGPKTRLQLNSLFNVDN